MIYKDYGRTGKKVSVIGFGGMRFYKYDGDYDYEKSAQVVRKANELGVNYFDTAPNYCDNKSEEIMGEAFKEMPGQFYVSTKSSLKKGDELRKQLENSLKKMGLQKINFFHIWCILNLNDFRSRMVKGGAYEAAIKAKSEGLIEHVAFSSHCNGEEIEIILKEADFEGMTIGYNILNFPFRQRGLQAAYNKGVGVATMNPLGGGIIPAKPDYFDFIRGSEDKSVVEAALRFNGSHKEISTVLAGMGSIEEVLENASVGDKVSELDIDEISKIQKRITDSMDKLCTGCRYCDGCPQDIPISKYLLAYNNKILGTANDAQNTMKWHWGITQDKAAECTACGLCERKCTQHLPIIERLKEITSW